MAEHNKNLVFVGKINLDIYGINSDIASLGDTKDFASDGMGAALGGASMNVARTVNKLARLYGDTQTTKIVSSIGQEPSKENYSNHDEYLLRKHVRQMAQEKMEYEGISCIDVAVGKSGAGIETSIVSGYKGGRHILKQPALSEQFNAANDGMISSVKARVGNEVGGAAYVFIDPARPALPAIAADVCHEDNVKTIVDYGFKEWPADAFQAEKLMNIMSKADVLIVPGDAFVPGMEEGKKDPDKLFALLNSDIYNARTVIMSDGMEPIRLCHNGKESTIDVTPAERVVNVNGAGDSRDGALMFYLSRGDEMEIAVQKATALASIRIQYPDNEWENHIYKHVKDNPLFTADLPELEQKALRMKPNNIFYLPGKPSNDENYDLQAGMAHD